MHQDHLLMPFRLGDDEIFRIAAGTEPDIFALTSHRVIVASEHHTALDVPIAAIRRIELDVVT